MLHECAGVVPQFRGEQRLDRGAHAVDDGAQIARLILGRPAQFFQGGENGTALRVAQHHDEPRAVSGGGEFDAADLRWRDDVARDADDEQVAQALIEHQLRRDAGIRAAEDDGERLLSVREVVAPGVAKQTLEAANIGGEAAVAFAQTRERFFCGDHVWITRRASGR